MASLLLLVLTVAAVTVYVFLGPPFPRDPSDAAPVIGQDEIGKMLRVAIWSMISLFLSALLAILSLIFGERRVAATISLAISTPIFLYFLVGLIWS